MLGILLIKIISDAFWDYIYPWVMNILADRAEVKSINLDLNLDLTLDLTLTLMINTSMNIMNGYSRTPASSNNLFLTNTPLPGPAGATNIKFYY